MASAATLCLGRGGYEEAMSTGSREAAERSPSAGGPGQEYLEEIARLKEVMSTKDAAHAKDMMILEDMVTAQMQRSAELEATIETMTRLEKRQTQEKSPLKGHPSSPSTPPSGMSPSKDSEDSLPFQVQGSAAGTGELATAAARAAACSRGTRSVAQAVSPSASSIAVGAGTGEARPAAENVIEEVAASQARHTAELLTIVAEMRQREQAALQLQAHMDASHSKEISELEEMAAVSSKRTTELQTTVAELRRAEQEHLARIAKDATRIAELEESLQAQQACNAELGAALAEKRRECMDQLLQIAKLQATIGKMSQAEDGHTQTIQQLEEAVTMRDVLLSNQASRIDLREQEHRLHLLKLQAYITRPDSRAAESGGTERAGAERDHGNDALLTEILEMMKRAERDYHFQRAATEAAGAAARSAGGSDGAARVAELQASNAVLEAALRKHRERTGELAWLEGEVPSGAEGGSTSHSPRPQRSRLLLSEECASPARWGSAPCPAGHPAAQRLVVTVSSAGGAGMREGPEGAPEREGREDRGSRVRSPRCGDAQSTPSPGGAPVLGGPAAPGGSASMAFAQRSAPAPPPVMPPPPMRLKSTAASQAVRRASTTGVLDAPASSASTTHILLGSAVGTSSSLSIGGTFRGDSPFAASLLQATPCASGSLTLGATAAPAPGPASLACSSRAPSARATIKPPQAGGAEVARVTAVPWRADQAGGYASNPTVTGRGQPLKHVTGSAVLPVAVVGPAVATPVSKLRHVSPDSIAGSLIASVGSAPPPASQLRQRSPDQVGSAVMTSSRLRQRSLEQGSAPPPTPQLRQRSPDQVPVGSSSAVIPSSRFHQLSLDQTGSLVLSTSRASTVNLASLARGGLRGARLPGPGPAPVPAELTPGHSG